MISGRFKYPTILRGLLVILSGTVAMGQLVRKCYTDVGGLSVCFIAEKNRDYRLRNWTQAFDYCQNVIGNGSTLPIISSSLAQFHLTEFLVENDFTLDSAWLGGQGFSSGWTWVDEKPFTGQLPSNPPSLSTPVAAITERFDGNETRGYISEESLDTEREGYICQFTGGTNCAGYSDGSSCFVRYDESINWSLARNKCLMRGGDLAKLTDTTDEGIVKMLGQLGYKEPADKVINKWSRYWIGLRKLWWKWSSGDEIKMVYLRDRPALADVNIAEQNYLVVDYHQQFAWGIREYNVSLQTICQGGTWTEPTTQAPVTAAPTVSLPVWAVGLICGLAGLVYIVSLIVVGIICCKCCGNQNSSGNEDDAGRRNSYTPEPKRGTHGSPPPQSPPKAPHQVSHQSAHNPPTAPRVSDSADYDDDEFDDDCYEVPEENSQPVGEYANHGQIANPHVKGRSRW